MVCISLKCKLQRHRELWALGAAMMPVVGRASLTLSASKENPPAQTCSTAFAPLEIHSYMLKKAPWKHQIAGGWSRNPGVKWPGWQRSCFESSLVCVKGPWWTCCFAAAELGCKLSCINGWQLPCRPLYMLLEQESFIPSIELGLFCKRNAGK